MFTEAIKGWLHRIWSFMDERHPLPSRLILSCLIYLGPAAFTAHVHGKGPSLWSISTVIGIFTVFNFYMILRLSDELKDIDLDTKNFPNRPLSSGRVSPWDLQLGLIILFLITSVLNLGTATAFMTAVGVLSYQFLMYRFFFIPKILRRRPLLNLVAHNPIFALIPLYSILMYAGESPASTTNIAWDAIVAFILMVWMPFLGWEISRKLRAPEANDPYDIYSPAMGRTGAVLSVVAAQTITLSIALVLTLIWSLSWIYMAIIATAYALALMANLRLLFAPSESSARLQPYAEMFIGTVLAAQLIGFGKAILLT